MIKQKKKTKKKKEKKQNLGNHMPIPTFIINLSSDKHRWLCMKQELEPFTSQLLPIRVDAIDAQKDCRMKEWKHQNRQKMSKYHQYSFIANGLPSTVLALFYSHQEAWKQFLAFDSSSPFAIIFEDDIHVQDASQWTSFLKDIQDSFHDYFDHMDLLSLGGHLSDTSYHLCCSSFPDWSKQSRYDLPEITSSLKNKWKRPHVWMYNSSYLISKKGAQRLIDYFRTHPILTHLDVMIHHLGKEGIIRLGCVPQPMIRQICSSVHSHSNNENNSSSSTSHQTTNDGCPQIILQWIKTYYPALHHWCSITFFQVGNTCRLSLYIFLWAFVLCVTPVSCYGSLVRYHLISMYQTPCHLWSLFFGFQCLMIATFPSCRKYWIVFWLLLSLYILHIFVPLFIL